MLAGACDFVLGWAGFFERGQELLLSDRVAEDDHLIGPAGGIDGEYRDGVAVQLGELLFDHVVVIGPVGQHGHDAILFDNGFYGARVDRRLEVPLARGAPLGREIDHDGLALGLQLGK